MGFLCRDSSLRVVFNPVLFSPSAADRRVNRDGNCCHQCEGGRADSRSYGSDSSRR